MISQSISSISDSVEIQLDPSFNAASGDTECFVDLCVTFNTRISFILDNYRREIARIYRVNGQA